MPAYLGLVPERERLRKAGFSAPVIDYTDGKGTIHHCLLQGRVVEISILVQGKKSGLVFFFYTVSARQGAGLGLRSSDFPS